MSLAESSESDTPFGEVFVARPVDLCAAVDATSPEVVVLQSKSMTPRDDRPARSGAESACSCSRLMTQITNLRTQVLVTR